MAGKHPYLAWQLLPVLSEEEAYLALFREGVTADCEGEPPRRERAPLASRPDLAPT